VSATDQPFCHKLNKILIFVSTATVSTADVDFDGCGTDDSERLVAVLTKIIFLCQMSFSVMYSSNIENAKLTNLNIQEIIL
jgi:hypothetical protein